MTKLSKYEQLALGIEIATQAHKGQFDKGGKPYILHPLHVMNQLMYDIQLATIGVMHDVVEDSSWTIEQLLVAGFSSRVCNALDVLTHDPKDDYLTVYIPRIALHLDTIRVKRIDLNQNSCITRLKSDTVSDKDIARVVKYHKAYIMLGKARKNFERR